MSCIKAKAFTFKNTICLILSGITLFVFDNTSLAAEQPTIVGRYYIAKDAAKTKYIEKTKWIVPDSAEWGKFLKSLKKLPLDSTKSNPLALNQSDVIHFNVNGSDLKSGHDVFISPAGIQHFARIPMNRYYDRYPEFSEFLESELSANLSSTYSSDQKGNIDTPGIVVVYRVSSKLNNPSWLIKESDTKRFGVYKKFLDTFVNIRSNMSSGKITSEQDYDVVKFSDDQYDAPDTFLLYLNYPKAQNQFIIIGKDTAIRGTTIKQEYSYYKDTVDYFSIFKSQAKDNTSAKEQIKNTLEERKKKLEEGKDLF